MQSWITSKHACLKHTDNLLAEAHPWTSQTHKSVHRISLHLQLEEKKLQRSRQQPYYLSLVRLPRLNIVLNERNHMHFATFCLHFADFLINRLQLFVLSATPGPVLCVYLVPVTVSSCMLLLLSSSSSSVLATARNEKTEVVRFSIFTYLIRSTLS